MRRIFTIAPNQVVLSDGEGTCGFWSYGVCVAKESSMGVILDERFWNCSKTTSKHLAQFLGLTTKQIKEGVKKGQFRLENLNNKII